jgi:hypothetical protein
MEPDSDALLRQRRGLQIRPQGGGLEVGRWAQVVEAPEVRSAPPGAVGHERLCRRGGAPCWRT